MSALPQSDAVRRAGADLERIRELRSRISSMQRAEAPTRSIATLPAFSSLLPGGSLQAGAAYGVSSSMTLLMGLLAGASAAGAWCAVVGVPEFGAEAAARFGIELSRLVLVPSPGAGWLAVTAALADALTIVVTRPGGRVADADASRLSARLRQRGTALVIAEGAGAPALWPGVEARLAVTQSAWTGIGRGHGYPSERLVTVRSELRSGRVRHVRLRLPGDYRADAAGPGGAVSSGAVPGGAVPAVAPALRLERVG